MPYYSGNPWADQYQREMARRQRQQMEMMRRQERMQREYGRQMEMMQRRAQQMQGYGQPMPAMQLAPGIPAAQMRRMYAQPRCKYIMCVNTPNGMGYVSRSGGTHLEANPARATKFRSQEEAAEVYHVFPNAVMQPVYA